MMCVCLLFFSSRSFIRKHVFAIFDGGTQQRTTHHTAGRSYVLEEAKVTFVLFLVGYKLILKIRS